MGLTEAARAKAQAELDRAVGEVARRKEQLTLAEERLDGLLKAQADRAQADRSQTEARLAKLKMDLSEATTQLQILQASAQVTDMVTKPGIIRDVGEPFRQTAEANVADAQAKVDDLSAQISQAEADLHPRPVTDSEEVTAARADVAKWQAKVDSAQLRVEVARKTISALDSVSGD